MRPAAGPRAGGASLTENVGWLAGVNALVKPAWFVFLLLTARRLGPGEFGAYMTAVALVSLIAVLLDFGLDTHVVRGLAAEPARFDEIFAHSLRTRLLSGALLAALAVAASRLVSGQALPTPLLVTTILYGGSNLLLLHLRTPFRAFEILRYEAESIAWEKGALIVIGAAALAWRPTAGTFMLATACANVVAMLWTLGLVARHVGLPRFPFRLGTLWTAVLRPALPFALMNAFAIVYFRSGTILLSALTHRPELVGQYNAGYRLVESYMFWPVMVVTPLYPVLARHLVARAPVADLLAHSVRAILPATLLLAAGLFVLSDDFTRLFFGHEFQGGALGVGLVCLTMVPVGLNFIFGTLVAAAGRQARSNVFIAGITAFNIVLNLFLIPRHGVAGAAVTTLLTETLLTASHLWVTRDRVPWRAAGTVAVRAALAVGGMALLVALVTRAWPFPGRLALLVGGTLVAFVALGVARRSDADYLLARLPLRFGGRA